MQTEAEVDLDVAEEGAVGVVEDALELRCHVLRIRVVRRDPVPHQPCGVSSKFSTSRRFFISSPLWTPHVYAPTS